MRPQDVNELIFGFVSAMGAVWVVIGCSLIATALAWIVGGVLMTAWAWFMFTESPEDKR